ncbi:hypothetical protein [Desulfonema magnum]|uniref:Glycosyl hydrolase n=1 Tax=Desulfonema magnum TaxID=45655 RepID=A0A975BSW0_9BACT|nr:hypothetical protein [Desulfonema magnum]QTA90753.1 Uncharacterized protein dnm_068140 [Desulfonema magnum]
MNNEIFIGTMKGYPENYNPGSVWHSTDGGDHWNDITNDLQLKRISDVVYKGGYLYAATWCANAYRLKIR